MIEVKKQIMEFFLYRNLKTLIMKKFILYLTFSLFGFISIAQTVTDFEGNIYNTVTIGSKILTTENLKSTKYNDGSAIPHVSDGGDWHSLMTPAYCWYNNDSVSYKVTYGALYNWYAVQTGKLCPCDWHVPSESEYDSLFSYLGGESVAGGKMKEVGFTHWISPNTGADNSSGFSALPGGGRDGYISKSPFSFTLGEVGAWWSSTEKSGGEFAFQFFIRYNSNNISYRPDAYDDKVNGFSIRCVKNIGTSIVNSKKTDDFAVFPNPTKDKLYIKHEISSTTYAIIFDVQGNQIINSPIDFGYIDVSTLAKGVYIIKIFDVNNVLVNKFIKE